MTDVSVHYYNNGWQDLTSYMDAFSIRDCGIQKVGNATVNFDTSKSNLSSFLANPYRLIRIRAMPNGNDWQNLFYGYVDTPNRKTPAGTITERVVPSLDCLSFEARLAADYVTYNYYDVTAALKGTEYAFTYRSMIEDFLAHPDSRNSARCTTGFDYGTGFGLVADADAAGIDMEVDGTGNWDNQTLFEAIRIIGEHLAYDGFYDISDDLSTTSVNLAPFSKSAAATLAAPFIDEPEWQGGSLMDVANQVFVEGGVDSGVPFNGDTWTELSKYRYNPDIWWGESWNPSTHYADFDGTVAVADVSNFAVFNSNYRVNSYCMMFTHTGFNGVSDGLLSKSLHTVAALNIANTEVGSVDCVNRCTEIHFNLKVAGGVDSGQQQSKNVYLHLMDGDGNEVICRAASPINGSVAAAFTKQLTVSVDLNTSIRTQPASLNPTSTQFIYADSSMTAFDWSNVVQVKIRVVHTWTTSAAPTGVQLFIDGLQFTGGQKISQFHALNPPALDQDSVDAYGIHPYKHTDSQINSFEMAQSEAARILNNLHNPIPTYKVKKIYGYDSSSNLWATQLRPSNVVTLSSVDYRVAEVGYDWSAKSKRVVASYGLVGKTSPLPPVWSHLETLRLLVR